MCWSSYTIQFGKAVDKQFASLYRTQSSYITPVIVKDEVPQKTDAFCCVYTTKLNSCVEKWILFAEIVAFAHSVSIFRPLSTVADDKVFLRKHQTRRPNAKESPHILATANCNCLKWQPFFHKLNDNFSLRTKQMTLLNVHGIIKQRNYLVFTLISLSAFWALFFFFRCFFMVAAAFVKLSALILCCCKNLRCSN